MLLYFICCKYLADNDKKCYYVLSYTSKLSSQCFVKKRNHLLAHKIFLAQSHLRGKQSSYKGLSINDVGNWEGAVS